MVYIAPAVARRSHRAVLAYWTIRSKRRGWRGPSVVDEDADLCAGRDMSLPAGPGRGAGSQYARKSGSSEISSTRCGGDASDDADSGRFPERSVLRQRRLLGTLQ